MKITIDFEAIKNWCSFHLPFVISAGLFFASWFAVKIASDGTVCDGLRTWWGLISAITGLGGLSLGAKWLDSVLK